MWSGGLGAGLGGLKTGVATPCGTVLDMGLDRNIMRAAAGTEKGGRYGWKPSSSPICSIQGELFELILLLKLDKRFPVEQFEATVSQSTVHSHPLRDPARSDRPALSAVAVHKWARMRRDSPCPMYMPRACRRCKECVHRRVRWPDARPPDRMREARWDAVNMGCQHAWPTSP